MNYVVEEMRAILEGTADLMHYGVKRRSGRYPYGSGKDPYQHGRDFLGRVEELKKNGWTETPENIKKEFGLSTTQYRLEKTLAKDDRKMLQIARAKSLQKDGLGATEIGRQMGVNESTVRGWLTYDADSRVKKAKETAEFIKKQVDERGMIDVGAGVENELNITRQKLNEALLILEREGYPKYSGRFEQVTNRGNHTTQTVICPPGTQHKDIYNLDQVHSLKEYISRDGGETYEKKFTYPSSMDSKRLMVRYKEDGGIDKDGIIELRRGVEDLSLGESRYSQVRILVDGTHYIKGMAVYSDNMPDGVDVIFNTNKSKDVPALGDKNNTVLKTIKNDPDNPFGSAIKDVEQGGQYWYTDSKTGEKKLGLINKRSDEGDWSEWKDALPSQFLSKQSQTMAKKQLDLAKADKLAEYDDICSINNPTIKKHFLQKFADSCDSAAVHLQAAALPGQKYHVIVPVNSLKDNEVYAPNYDSGTKLALIRYPHGGTFEIPILTVNNKHKAAIDLLGKDVRDVVAINSKVAERLSGADFDGDTVMCIPTHDSKGRVKIASTPELDGLKGFDPKTEYGHDEVKKDADGTEHYYRNGREFRVMKNTGTQMGVISNLITDMTLLGANTDELARAVRHSMVVIDAEKHKLDYKQSALDNDIASLHKAYQGKRTGGAATIVSKAKGQYQVDRRQGSPKINIKGTPDYDPTKPEGALLWKTSDKVEYQIPKVNKKTGEITMVTKRQHQKSTKMAEFDPYDLVSESRHPMELIYADYASSMKALANEARKNMITTGNLKYDPVAHKTYRTEVDSLNDKLVTSLLNTPREREAQRRANVEVEAKRKAYKEETGQKMKSEDVKKISQQALSKYRTEVDTVARRKRFIEITDKEWEAIQAGAVSENVLKKILNNADVDELRQRATPRTTKTLSTAQINRIKAYQASNYDLATIANKMGVSPSTVSKYLKGVS